MSVITEYRKQYLKRWRREHRDHIRSYFRKWSSAGKEKPISNDLVAGYYGTSGLGKKYELIAQSMLKGSIPSPNFHYPFDLNWNGVRVEVKMRNKNGKGVYHFTRKPKCVADYFLCFCVDMHTKYVLLFPESVYKAGLNLTDKNVNDKYKGYLVTNKDQ